MPERPRVAQVITRFILGGAQLVCLSAAKGMRELGWEVEIWAGPAIGAEGDLFFYAFNEGITVRKIPEMRREIHPNRDFRSWLHLKEHVRRFSPHVVHTHSSKAGVLGRLAAKSCKVPAVVHTVHGLPFGYGRDMMEKLYPCFERSAARSCDRVFCVSRSLVAKMREHSIADESKISYMPWGLDLSRFKRYLGKLARARMGIGTNSPTIVIPARLAPDKGHEDALMALSVLVDRFDELRLLLVGDGPLREPLQDLARSMGMGGNVVFAGRVPPRQMPHFLAAGDITLLPSYREGMPVVLAESFVAGRPVIAYDTDGVGELVRHLETGELVEQGDVEGLALALEKLLSNPELRTKYAANGSRLIGEQFAQQVMAKKLDTAYREILREKNIEI
ncbi:MAG: glycosyltransferase family 4 protein [Planctomycetota bacterium]|nr:glycosyltransferase family 4 protein [Planctomycetota bacterium]